MKLIISLLFIIGAAIPCQSIVLDKQLLDFGSVKEGEIPSLELTLENNSDSTLKIGARPSCDCVTADPMRMDLGKHQKEKITIKVDTKGYNGVFDENVFIQSNDPIHPYIAVALKGNVVAKNTTVIPVTLFGSARCLVCLELKEKTLPGYEKSYNVVFEVTQYDINKPENYAMLSEWENRSGKTLNKVPVLFIGDDVIGGKKEITEQLPGLIEKYKKSGGAKKFVPSVKKNSTEINLRKLKLLPIITAGLIDSINPCAFATIIFFISYLRLVLKKEKHEIILSGISFVFGVYLTYFLIGIGLFRFLSAVSGFVTVSKIMYISVGVLSLALGVQHLREAYKIRATGNIENSIQLKLPEFIRAGLYSVIKKFSSFQYLILTAFILAVIVTLLELFCTGQVYLPTIIYMVSLHDYRMQGIYYLAFYCFLFVSPILIILTMLYFGMTTESLKRFFQKNIVAGKTIMAGFFLLLGTSILIHIF